METMEHHGVKGLIKPRRSLVTSVHNEVALRVQQLNIYPTREITVPRPCIDLCGSTLNSALY